MVWSDAGHYYQLPQAGEVGDEDRSEQNGTRNNRARHDVTRHEQEKSFEHKRQKLWAKESREKGTRSSSELRTTKSHFGSSKKFSCEIRIGIKSTIGKRTRDGKAKMKKRV